MLREDKSRVTWSSEDASQGVFASNSRERPYVGYPLEIVMLSCCSHTALIGDTATTGARAIDGVRSGLRSASGMALGLAMALGRLLGLTLGQT
jgi:hypothetical protein